MVSIIDFGSKKTPVIKAAIDKLSYQNQIFQWIEFDEKKLKEVDSIILSGAPVLFTEIDYQPYLNRFMFLKDSPIPILGICFGHQLIGLIHGSEVYKGDAVRELTEVEIVEQDALFKDLGRNPKMMEDHTEGTTLPPDFMCLAKSDKYEVEVMKHNLKPIYGVQFHPEVSGTDGEKLLGNFLSINQ